VTVGNARNHRVMDRPYCLAGQRRHPHADASRVRNSLSGNEVRLQAIYNVEAYVPPAISFVPAEEPGEVSVQTSSPRRDAASPAQVGLKSVAATIEKGAKLDPSVADAVASAMKGLGVGERARPITRTCSTRDR